MSTIKKVKAGAVKPRALHKEREAANAQGLGVRPEGEGGRGEEEGV